MRLYEYLKSPQYNIGTERLKLKTFLKLYFLLLFVLLILQLIINYFVVIPENVMSETTSELLIKKILVVILLIPLIEEVVFRLWLKNYRYNLQIGFIVVLVYGTVVAIFNNSIIAYFGPLMAILILVILACRYIINFQEKYFKYMFYISCLSFGIMHIINFEGFQSLELYKIPLYTMPQIIIGIFIGYIRMNYGFVYGLLYHYLINSIPLIISCI